MASLPPFALGDGVDYDIVPAAGLPPDLTAGLSMDAKAADLDGDRDLDPVVAMEWAPHVELFNDGKGRFREASDRPRADATTNGAMAVDVDTDGDRDLVFANAGADQAWINDAKSGVPDESTLCLPPGTDVLLRANAQGKGG